MSTACDISLSIWISQGFETTCPILGIPILWWGRIGKLFQFVGGITVLLELIGFERVEEYVKELQDSVSQLIKTLDELLNTLLKLASSVIRFLISAMTWKSFSIFTSNVDIAHSIVTANLSKFNLLTSLNINSSNSVEKLTFNIFRFSYIPSLLVVMFGLFRSLHIDKEFFNPLLENGVTFSELFEAILGIALGLSVMLFIVYALNLFSIFFSLILTFSLLSFLIVVGVIGKILGSFIDTITQLLARHNLDKLTKWLAFIMFILGSTMDFIVS